MNIDRIFVYRSMMRTILLPLLLALMLPIQAQRLDPDQNPYWTRYCFVEDSDKLQPLKGHYKVYYIQRGMWWTVAPLDQPVSPGPDDALRTRPLFGPEFPPFRATPARGTDLPDVKLVVIRERDTMVVELSVHYPGKGAAVEERCRHMDCTRRPPVVLPFRPGRFLANGRPFVQESSTIPDTAQRGDARTVALTGEFDRLWQRAMQGGRVLPQLNTDTCEQEVLVPAELDVPGTGASDAWLLRSAYCGTHFAHFPAWGTATEYIITFKPSQPEEKKDPVHIRSHGGDDPELRVDVTDWPVGDHEVQLFACGNGGSFILKLR